MLQSKGLQRARHDLASSQHMWERPRKTESLAKMAKTFTYLHPFSPKDKRGCWRKGFGTSNGEEGNSHGDGKENIMFGK